MPYRPPGVKVLGISTIVAALFNIYWGAVELPLMSTSSTTFLIGFSTFPALLSLILIFVAGGILLVGAVGLLSMTRLGYYTALASSVVLIVDFVLILIIGWVFIMFLIGAILGLILGIVMLAYLLSDAKYNYPILVSKEESEVNARRKGLAVLVTVLFLFIFIIRWLTYIQNQNPFSLFSPLWPILFVAINPQELIPQLFFYFYNTQPYLQNQYTSSWFSIVISVGIAGLYLGLTVYYRWRAHKKRADESNLFPPP